MKKGLRRVLDAWARCGGRARSSSSSPSTTSRAEGVRVEQVRGEAFRALVRRARVYVVAPRREDFGIAQLEALADGCHARHHDARGPVRGRARSPRSSTRAWSATTSRGALRTALDDPLPGYAERAASCSRRSAPRPSTAPSPRELLPRLLGDQGA